jgi:enterochelin esterase family protein
MSEIVAIGEAEDKLAPGAVRRKRRPRLAGEFRVDRENRHPLITRLVETGATSRARADLLKDRTLPLVEPGSATFIWLGEADSVVLRHFMSLSHGPFPFERIGDQLWHLRLAVPAGARFEYKIDIGRNGGGEWINDPLNPEVATDPFGANSVCMTWGYEVPDWARPDADAPQGRIERTGIPSAAFGGERPVGLYLPAGYEPGRAYPLVVVHDGFDYVAHAALQPVLDNLIHRGDLPPLIAALTQSPDRTTEYVDDPRHAAFLAEELVPALEARHALAPEPTRRVLMGASLGAVAALSTADRIPRAFGGLVLKSGSFVVDRRKLATRGDVFHRVNAFVQKLSEEERLARRAYVTCGRYEALASENRQIAAFLRQTGVRTRYAEPKDAHHWHNWRDQARAGLMWCLGPARGATAGRARGHLP